MDTYFDWNDINFTVAQQKKLEYFNKQLELARAKNIQASTAARTPLPDNEETKRFISGKIYNNIKRYQAWRNTYWDPNPIHLNPHFRLGMSEFFDMDSDPKIKAVFNTRHETLENKEWYVNPAIPNDERELIKAGFEKQVLKNIPCLNQKKREIKRDMEYGYSRLQKVVGFQDVTFSINVRISAKKNESRIIKIKDALVIKDFEAIPPTAISFDDNRDTWFNDGKGKVRILSEEDKYYLVKSTFDPVFDSMYGWPLKSSLFSYRVMKKAIQAWRLCYIERFGMPIPHGKYPQGMSKDDPSLDDFEQRLAGMMQSAYILSPEDFAIEFINDYNKYGSMDVFANGIDYCDHMYTELVLGHQQMTEATSIGSLASSNVKEGQLRQDKTEMDGYDLDTVIDGDVGKFLIDMNFPSNGLYPEHYTKVEQGENQKVLQEKFYAMHIMGEDLSRAQIHRELHVDYPMDDMDILAGAKLGEGGDIDKTLFSTKRMKMLLSKKIKMFTRKKKQLESGVS